jgi:NAD(P)-dependent dehydrogenase (short-subunit alcohol dehydrogenase family)
MDFRLEGRVALVTGAARGIGRAIALELAAAGADVAIGDVHLAPFTGERYYVAAERRSGEEEDVPTNEAVRAAGRRSMGLEFDVADRTAVDDAVARIAAELGPVDVLVNNAGIVNNIAPIGQMSAELWDREIGVNLTGAFNCIQATVPVMAERGWGRVVNISSLAALTGIDHQPAYAATKAGLLGLMKTVTREFGRRGVTCNCVLPGLIATPMVRAMPERILDGFVRTSMSGRLGEPEDIAAMVAFLASPAASYVNAQAIAVDGGMHLGPARG